MTRGLDARLVATDWRETQNAMVAADPMRRRPAPRLGDLPDNRVVNLTYRYDWLANQTEWTDDAGAFYERSLGSTIRNGYTEGQPNGGALRPTALYLAAQLPESPSSPIDPAADRGGWVRVRYGESGNATSVTVRARCHDVSAATACWDDANESDVDQRAAQLLSTCRCDQEQHYEYRWDELNRLAEARRYDRAGSGDWALQVRQRYRYDAGNIRTLKETVDGQSADPSGNAVGGVERVALYVMPGDFERRGLVTNRITDTYDASLALGTETQYLVAGARVVWKPGAVGGGGTGFDRDARVTLAMSNLLQSTAGVVDLVTGALLEVATYYPNGARETLRANSDVEEFALEPVGFTGKEDDSEVGLVYFGMRYLMPHLGRWASPDPLQIHAGGGGEFGNSYHYVSGSLLQARDPLGLNPASAARVAVRIAGGAARAGRSPAARQSLDDILARLRPANDNVVLRVANDNLPRVARPARRARAAGAMAVATGGGALAALDTAGRLLQATTPDFDYDAVRPGLEYLLVLMSRRPHPAHPDGGRYRRGSESQADQLEDEAHRANDDVANGGMLPGGAGGGDGSGNGIVQGTGATDLYGIIGAIARIHHLGFDPAVKRFRAHEAATALRIERELDVALTRGTKSDWIDAATGTTYDSVGGTGPQGQFNVQQFTNQLNRHIDKYDVSVVDFNNFHSPESIQEARDAIGSLPEERREKVIVIERE